MTAAHELPPATASPIPSAPAPAAPNTLPGHPPFDAQIRRAGEGATTRPTNRDPTPEVAASGGPTTPPPTMETSPPNAPTSAGAQHGRDQQRSDAQALGIAAGSQRVTQRHAGPVTHRSLALGDPLLYLAAASLDDLERTRIAAENRLRELTRQAVDPDGEERGYGLPADNPLVRQQQSIVDGLVVLEHGAELALKRQLRKHPLHGWIKGTVGVGERQGARLLAAIGDPYWNTLHNRPRTVSELWAYCGYKVVPAGHVLVDTQQRRAGGPQDSLTDQACSDAQGEGVGGEQQDSDPGHTPGDSQTACAGVAVRRRKGQQANWSTVAKTRAYLIAERCMIQVRSPYRSVYDTRKAHTEGVSHAAPCVRCGPPGHPAAVGSVWRPAHRHADALRIVAKQILKDLWRAARDVHQQAAGQRGPDTQTAPAGGPQWGETR